MVVTWAAMTETEGRARPTRAVTLAENANAMGSQLAQLRANAASISGSSVDLADPSFGLNIPHGNGNNGPGWKK